MEKAGRRKRSAWTAQSEAGYQRDRIERAWAGNRPTLDAFAEWLAKDRGLGSGSITVRLHSACSFVDAVSGGSGVDCIQALQALSADGIEDFFVQYCKDHGSAARRSMRSGMRLFLEFAARQDWVREELLEAVPSLRSYRLSGVPRGLSEEHISTLLASPWEGAECVRRDRAIVVLLATYGVRRGQISALQLTDIDWQARTVDFAAHKGGKAVQHVLTECVAEWLADYLRNERPASDCHSVFLRARAPHLRLSPTAISVAVSSRMKRVGLPPQGTHAFRHAFATRLLRAEQPVKAIADLLGHRSLCAVAVYAKVDHPRLFEVAVDWPEVVS